MKLKITEPGWANFTGDFGGVQFTENVSDDDVAPFVAQRLANLISIETLEGANPSSSQQVLDSQGVPMSVVADAKASTAGPDQKAAATAGPKHSKESLQALADKEGIAGLRKVAEPFGVSARSINDLITGILNKQAADGGEPPVVVLLGSSVQPSTFLVDGQTIQLGSVVAAAHQRSELTPETWNELPAEIREKHIADQVEALKAP